MIMLSTNLLIDIALAETNSTNSIELAEYIEQYFDKEVNIDYVEFYLEKHGAIDTNTTNHNLYYTTRS